MYKVEFIDWCGQSHSKTYKSLNLAIKNRLIFAVFIKMLNAGEKKTEI